MIKNWPIFENDVFDFSKKWENSQKEVHIALWENY